MPKYEFTGETKTIDFCGRFITLKRIRRIKDGFIGGWIEKEENLSHKGICFVQRMKQWFLMMVKFLKMPKSVKILKSMNALEYLGVL